MKNITSGSDAMRTSTSNVFCRVNRRRPCRICGKPDCCSYYVRDGELISICMRVSDGARKAVMSNLTIKFVPGLKLEGV